MTMNVHLEAEEVRSISELYRKPSGIYFLPAHDPNDDPIPVSVVVAECEDRLDVELDDRRFTPGEARHLAAVLLAAAETAAWAVVQRGAL